MSKGTEKRAKDALSKFLKAWKEGDYQAIFDSLQYTWSRGKNLAQLKHLFPKPIESYRTVKTTGVLPTVVDFLVDISMEGETRRVRIRLVAEKGAFMPDPKGDFGVNPISIRKV